MIDKLGYAALTGLIVWLTIGDSRWQTSIELFPPWSGSYIYNSWLVPVVPGKPGVATVPGRYLLMTGQNQVVGELANKADAINALYGAELQAAARDMMAATVSGVAVPGAVNAFRLRVGPVITAIDAIK